MDYTNPQGVRFKVVSYAVGNRYSVKYYTGVSQWPRTVRDFQCPTDELRREMFFIIGSMRLCTTCKVDLLGHNDDPEQMTCQTCILKAVALAGLDGSSLPECPVCYQKMLTVDASKRTLACRHNMCPGCTRRLMKPTGHVHYDNLHRPYHAWSITCPMCRDVAYYDGALRPVVPNTHV